MNTDETPTLPGEHDVEPDLDIEQDSPDLDLPEDDEDVTLQLSPYLNIYGYPAELDYDDLVPRPSNLAQLDAFCREVVGEKFEVPEALELKPGEKLIYVSLGSMGSVDVDLMKRILAVLEKTPHKYIVSKGQRGDEYDLPSNCWGQNFLPQTSVLPLVDLVITHGGNNTITETFQFGKPMIVMPLFADQYDNAQRVQEKGYGVRLEPYSFTERELLDSIDRLLSDSQLHARLQAVKERIAKTNSKEVVCKRIEQVVEVKNSNS